MPLRDKIDFSGCKRSNIGLISSSNKLHIHDVLKLESNVLHREPRFEIP